VSKQTLQIAKRKISNFEENSDNSFLIEIYRRLNGLSPLHSTRRTLRTPDSVSKQTLQIAKRKISNFDENSDNSSLIEIYRRLNGLSTPFYTLNVAHANFSAKTIPANRKMKTFRFQRKLSYFVPE
jgi:hypothetical protein